MEDANGNGVYDAGTETDWQNPQTVAGTADSLNTIYDDVDLSGDGIVGGIKKALGMSPFDTSNPLTLTQYTTGGEPQIATFDLPLNYQLLAGNSTTAGIGEPSLWLDGGPGPQLQGAVQNTSDGSTLLVWNTAFDAPGQHILQARLELTNTYYSTASSGPITTAFGPLTLFQTANAVQFDTFYSSYDSSGATFHGLTTPGAAYTITVTDPNGNTLNTFTGTADSSSGEINVSWNLVESDGTTVYSGSSFNANFTIGDPTTWTETLSKAASVSYGDGDFTVAYMTDQSQLAGYQENPGYCTMNDMIQYGIVDPSMAPYPYTSNPYNTDFNLDTYDDPNQVGNAGYIAGPADTSPTDRHHYVSDLMTSLEDSATRNFYCYSHGAPTWIADAPGQNPDVIVYANNVGQALGNYNDIVYDGVPPSYPVPISHRDHPYRFVFLDGCSTAVGTEWPEAFGIPQYEVLDVTADPDLARAFLGWSGETFSIGNEKGCNQYLYTLNEFFSLWDVGDNNSLAYCVAVCTSPNALWNIFVQDGVSRFDGYDGQPVFPDGEKDVLPMGRQTGYYETHGGSGPTLFPDGRTTKIYGYKWITRTGHN